MGFWAHELDYDPATGRATYKVEHAFSSESLVDYTWTLTAWSRTAVVEIRDPSAEVAPGRLSGRTGSAVGEDTEVLFGQ